MQIQFIKNKSEVNRLNKELTIVKEVTVNLKNPENVNNFSVIISRFEGLNTCNYAYVNALNRFYFINDIEFLNNNNFRVYFKVDVLTTYKEKILSQRALVSRNSTKANFYLNDDRYKIENRTRTVTKKFPNSFSGDSILLVVNGGTQNA